MFYLPLCGESVVDVLSSTIMEKVSTFLLVLDVSPQLRQRLGPTPEKNVFSICEYVVWFSPLFYLRSTPWKTIFLILECVDPSPSIYLSILPPFLWSRLSLSSAPWWSTWKNDNGQVIDFSPAYCCQEPPVASRPWPLSCHLCHLFFLPFPLFSPFFDFFSSFLSPSLLPNVLLVVVVPFLCLFLLYSDTSSRLDHQSMAMTLLVFPSINQLWY